MNRYGYLALARIGATTTSRPTAPSAKTLARCRDQGERIAVQVSALADEMLGRARPGETLVEYLARGRRALSVAEEIVLDQELASARGTEGEPGEETGDDPALARYYEALAEISSALASPEELEEPEEPEEPPAPRMRP